MKRSPGKSHCPINFTLELLGDNWSLLILRDIHLFGKRRFKDFLESEEGISTNILADRLGKLERSGILEKVHGLYQPTEKGLDLLPLLIEMSLWGAKYDPNTSAPPEFVMWAKSDPEAFRKGVEEIAEGTRPPPLARLPI